MSNISEQTKKLLMFFLVMFVSIITLSACSGNRRGGSVQGQVIVNSAEKHIGIPYRYGGKYPKTGFDCSGLTWYVYGDHGIEIPRVSRDQAKVGKNVSRNKLQPGDLVFFRSPRSRAVSHVGIYAGRGIMIHAPSSGKTVERRKIKEDYYWKNYHSSRRIIR